jgi:hypothetical protein
MIKKFIKLGLLTKDVSLVLTDSTFYLFFKNKIKCKVDIEDELLAITKSASKGGEFVLHFKSVPDRRLKSEYKEEIIEVTKKIYKNLT